MSRKNTSVVSPLVKQCFVTIAVGFNIIAHGSAIGFPGILLPQLKEPGSSIELTTVEESWLASVYALSVLFGNFLTAPISDRLGRKAAHIALTIPFFVGWFMTVLAADVKVLVIGRMIIGVSAGLLITLRSVLVGEYTSPKHRGAFLATISLTQAFGIFFIHLIGSLFSWQICALICAFFPFISLLMIIYTPESPSWLASKGRYDECREIFRWLRGDGEEDELEEMIDAQMELEKSNIKNSKVNHNWLSTARHTIVKKEFYKPIVLMIHANVLMQFAGGTIMAAYSTVILSKLMGPAANIHFWMVFLDAQRIVANTAAVFIITKVKRRTMMFSTGAVCVAAHLAIVVYVYWKNQDFVPVEGIWLPVLLINIQFFTVGMAMVPMPNVIAGEIFPLEYRSIAGAISMFWGGITMFLALKTFLSLIDAIGLSGTYLLYAAILAYCLSVMWIMLPETKGRTLQQIEDEFRGRPLKADEIEVRRSLRRNPVEMYNMKLSASKCSVTFE